MSKTIVLIGHCGPDSSYLQMAVRSAARQASIISVGDDASLAGALAAADVALVNRALDGDFADASGIELIGRLRAQFPKVRFLLISNYADAQTAARAAGAVTGFGKRDIGSPVAVNAIREALGEEKVKESA